MFFQYGARERLNLAERDSLHSSTLKAETEPPYSAEQVKNPQTKLSTLSAAVAASRLSRGLSFTSSSISKSKSRAELCKD